MAGNVSAFNTVWTYDIYQSYIRPTTGNKEADDKHYLKVGRVATILGVLASIAAAFIASKFGNIMDFLQAIFSMINAPLFAVILLGMFWKRSTGNAAFTGLLAGFLIALLHHGLSVPEGATTLVKGGWIAPLITYPVEMAQNFWTAIYAFSAALLLTVILSLLAKRTKTDEELNGLVYSMTPRLDDSGVLWYKRPWFLAVIVGVMFFGLTILFW
jgi:SSS family solute:Na+ symporter